MQQGEDRRKLRRATYAGSPLGDDGFVKRWRRVAEGERNLEVAV
jgi:hypothetical protein